MFSFCQLCDVVHKISIKILESFLITLGGIQDCLQKTVIKLMKASDGAKCQDCEYGIAAARERFFVFLDPAISSCFMIFTIQWLAFVVLVDICTSKKLHLKF